ncbi:DUF3134 family protein [Roseofilum casamattae]|uniref:DUF3134 family protein n=1 Tax=Roseofilum casamattae BLCC-M143 TaxID=3022442 RepID=A0ABT7C2T5_9CYAN|nr:DUF3134 family protein [Roseofilum casamattae]MDJ1185777.1 DUF3134 family protein [Roseofilum casamattae BLCC-M143]
MSKFVPIKNPSLRETPRSQLAPILPSPQTLSLVDWLEQTNRMSARNPEEEPEVREGADVSEIINEEDDFDSQEEEMGEEE